MRRRFARPLVLLIAVAAATAASSQQLPEEKRETLSERQRALSDSIAKFCEMAPELCLTLDAALESGQLDLYVKEWRTDGHIMTISCDTEAGGPLTLFIGNKVGTSFASSLLHADPLLTVNARAPDFPLETRAPRIDLRVNKLERGDEDGDWIATLGTYADPEDVLNLLSTGPAFEIWFPLTVTPMILLDEVGKANETVIAFAESCRVALGIGTMTETAE